MKKHLGTFFAIIIFGIFGTASVFMGASYGKTHSYHNKISEIDIGVVTDYIPSGFLWVNFSDTYANSCGDTEILGFVELPSGLRIQLKPVFLPEEEANKLQGSKSIVFPVIDIFAFLQEPGEYKLKLYIKNDCGIFNKEATGLPEVSFKIQGVEPTGVMV